MAQGTKADYDRAAALPDLTRGKVFRDRIEPHWSGDNRCLWYMVRSGPRQWEFVRVDVDNGRRGPAFDHQRLAKTLESKKIVAVSARRLPIENLQLDPSGRHVDLAIGGRWWRCDLKTYALAPRPGGAPADATAGRALAGRALRPWTGAPRASKETGAETTVTFINRTSASVELFWLDTNGKRQSYGRLRPGEEHQQHTFAGHVWLVTGAQGRPLGVKVAEDADATVEIRENPLTSPQDESEDDADMPPQAQGASQRRRPFGRAFSPRSPDGRWEAFIKDHNVYVRDSKGAEFVLSRDGTAEDDGAPAEWVDGRFCWSPDSQKLLAVRTRHCEERKVYFIESSPRDQVQPKLHSHAYAKPGDPLPIDRPQLFDLKTKKPVPIDRSLFDNPWSIGDYRWAADSSRFTFVYNQRGHQVLRLLAVDAANGAVRTIIDEHSPTFIDYSGKYFLRYVDAVSFNPEPTATVKHGAVADGSGLNKRAASRAEELIWMSERDGWNHLYLYDFKTGRIKNQITKGPWVVRGVDRVDEAKRQIWFRAGGIHLGQDPYYIHYCRVNFDGTGLTVLTEGDGTHKIDFSPDGTTFIDTYSRVDMPPVTELRRTSDGSLVCGLERGTMEALLHAGWQPPERFVAKGRDGATDIYGAIFRPTTFDPRKHYPVIEQIYAGPQDSFVPKNFHSFYPQQALAELGFIVVQIDGMGTSNRSKKFHERLLEEPGRLRAARPHLVDSRGGQEVSLHGHHARRHLRRFGGRAERGRRRDDPRRFLQGGGRRLRMPRQPHGQDLVERAVDGLARGTGVPGELQRDLGPRLEGQAAVDRSRDGHERRSGLDDAGGRRLDSGGQGFRAAGGARLEPRRGRIALRPPPPRRLLRPQPAGRGAEKVAGTLRVPSAVCKCNVSNRGRPTARVPLRKRAEQIPSPFTG